MHPFRPIVLAGVGFALLSMLLPFASFPVIGSIDGLSADAWPALLPLIPVVLLSLTGRWEHALGPTPGIAAVALCGLSLVFSLVKVADSIVSVRDTADATLGTGAWVLTAAVMVATSGAAFGSFSRS